MKTVAIIPARLGSSRFPGKPLARLAGRSMIEHIYWRTRLCPSLEDVYVATCDQEIATAVEGFGGRCLMTSPAHERASDRIAEAARQLSADLVVMVQGDEPLITPAMITAACAPFEQEAAVVCVNLAAPIHSEEEFQDRNCIKVVAGRNGNALYFSREPIPNRNGARATPIYKQVCVIPFRRSFLLTFAELEPTPLEKAESIDMLRALEHGFPVRLVACSQSTHAVDTPEDLVVVERLLLQDPITQQYPSARGRA